MFRLPTEPHAAKRRRVEVVIVSFSVLVMNVSPFIDVEAYEDDEDEYEEDGEEGEDLNEDLDENDENEGRADDALIAGACIS